MVRKQVRKEHSIAGLASAGGVGVETVRYYQRRGLLEKPDRAGNAGHGSAIRRYGEKDVRRLRFIRAARAAGFNLAEIGELILLDASEHRLRARALAYERIAVLDATIAELKRARRALAGLARDCSASDVGPCPILTAFEQGPSSRTSGAKIRDRCSSPDPRRAPVPGSATPPRNDGPKVRPNRDAL